MPFSSTFSAAAGATELLRGYKVAQKISLLAFSNVAEQGIGSRGHALAVGPSHCDYDHSPSKLEPIIHYHSPSKLARPTGPVGRAVSKERHGDWDGQTHVWSPPVPAAKACHMAKRRVVLAVICWARAPRGGDTGQGVVLPTFSHFLIVIKLLSLSLFLPSAAASSSSSSSTECFPHAVSPSEEEILPDQCLLVDATHEQNRVSLIAHVNTHYASSY